MNVSCRFLIICKELISAQKRKKHPSQILTQPNFFLSCELWSLDWNKVLAFYILQEIVELSTPVKWGIYSIGHVSNISIRFSKVSLLKLPYLSGLVNYSTIHYFNTQFYDKEKTSKRVFGLESWALYQKWCDSCRQLPANTAYLRLSLSWKLSSLMLTSFTTTGAKQ